MSNNPQHAEEVWPEESELSPEEQPRTKRRGRRIWWIIGAIVVVVAIIVIVILLTRPASSTPAPVTRVQDATAQMSTIQSTVTASGTINPAQRADLSFSSSGTVTSVKVAVGDAVKTGDALAAIDLTDLKSAVDAAQSSVDAAQSDYNTTVKSSSSSSQQIAAAKSTLKSKQNDLANAKTALADGTLTAPFDGTVAIVNISEGDKVTGSGGSGSTGASNTGGGGYSGSGASNTSSSSTAITLISTDTYQVTTSVGSADVGSLAKGQSCTVVPNGTTDQLPGTVASVGVIATSSDSSGATFPVVIDITGSQQGLYAGVNASITIVTSSRQALMIPTLALSYENGQPHVQKKTDTGVVDTIVQTGVSNGGQTEITAGLNQGDTVEITITISATAGNRTGGLGGFQTMFGGGGRQRPSGGGSGGVYRTAGGNFPSGGVPTDFQGGYPTDAGGGQAIPIDINGAGPVGGQPTS